MSPVPPPAVGDLMEEIQRVLAEANDNVKDQHVVSKVLLKRFAAPQGQFKRLIAPFSVIHPDRRLRPRGPDGCGKIDHFVPVASRSLEMHWKQTEDRLHDTFELFNQPDPFANQEHIDLIKDAIALHFVRSPAVKQMHVKVFQNALAHTRALMMTDALHLLDRGFQDRYGREPASLDERAAFVDELTRDLVEAARRGVLFRSRIEELFPRARDLLSGFGVEIITPAHGEFLIGDVPALTLRHGQLAVGVRAEIAIGDANTIIMPFGPKQLVALGPKNARGRIPSIEVNRVNAMQVQAAEQYVYFRPGSGLETDVRAMLPLRTLARASHRACVPGGRVKPAT